MSELWQDKSRRLMKVLAHNFQDPALLRLAISHRSSGVDHNERLEFLGDSILNFVIAAELYSRFPAAREGDLTRLRAGLVRGLTLAEIARELKLGEYLSLGMGEQRSGGHQRDSILADALEAIIGALYLDANIELCRARLLEWYKTRLDALVLAPGGSSKDAKTRLQEYLQARHMSLPEYQVQQVGGDPHNPVFEVYCSIALLPSPLVGIANTRRQAEQNAADAALEALKNAR